MKKFTAFILALLLTLSLCACGGTGDGGSGTGGMDNYRSNIARTPEEAAENYAGMRTFDDYCGVFGINAAETLRSHYTTYLYQNTDGSLEKMREEILSEFPNQLAEVLFTDGSGKSAYVLMGEDKTESFRSKLVQASSADELISICVEASMEYLSADFEYMMIDENFNISISNISKRELSGDEYSDALNALYGFVYSNSRVSAFVDTVFQYTPEAVNGIYVMSFNYNSNGETDYADEALYVAETADGCFIFTLW